MTIKSPLPPPRDDAERFDFMSQIKARAQALDTRICVGIDPHPEFVDDVKLLERWSLDLANATAPFAICFKVNIAFFEAFGAAGLATLERLMPQLQALAPVILDAKRGDISSTANAYARAAFERWGAQGLTVSPYLGLDSVNPYLKYPQAGLFILCHTSNPGAASLQRRRDAAGRAIYETVIDLAQQHPHAQRMGFVVGATQPEALRRARQLAPHAWLLCPGVGAQGGQLDDVISAAWGAEGHVLIAASRSIARAPDPALEARRLRDEVRRAACAQLTPHAVSHHPVTSKEHHAALTTREPSTPLQMTRKPSEALSAALAQALLRASCVMFGEFTLKSGLTSPIYIDLRRLSGDPGALQIALDAYSARYAELCEQQSFDALAGLPLAGLPLATGLALRVRQPLCYPRPPKRHGTQASVEGGVRSGSRLLMIDDLATRGVSAIEALHLLREDYLTHDLLVLIDRESGAAARLSEYDVKVHAVITLSALLDEWERTQAVPLDQLDAARRFIASSQG